MFKFLISGDTGSGKTGSLASLIKAGYRVRILNLDNGIEVLRYVLTPEEQTRYDSVEFRTLYEVSGGRVIPIDIMRTMMELLESVLEVWPNDRTEAAEWGENSVLVVDTLTQLGFEALEWGKRQAPVGGSGKQHGQAAFFSAQTVITQFLSHITAPQFKTNVIVFTHLEEVNGRLWPSIEAGRKPLHKIPRHFNTWLQTDQNASGRREIYTSERGNISLKFPNPKAPSTLPAETGLATLVELLKPVETP